MFLSLAHICDMFLEHPNIRASELMGVSPDSSTLFFAVASSAANVIGILFLIYGFIRIIKYQKEEEKLVKNLETLLPICSNCKKYRTDEGQWMPIEKYLVESGAPRLTHGICPDCAKELYGNLVKKI